MCLDTGAFLLVDGEQETPLDHVASVTIAGNGLKLIDVFGKSRQIAGRIGEIDLLNRRIVLA